MGRVIIEDNVVSDGIVLKDNRKDRGGSRKKRAEFLKGININYSQVRNDILNNLSNNMKLNDFVACIRYCSGKQYSIAETCQVLTDTFRWFVKDKLNVLVLEDMIKNNRQISEAWSYGTGGGFIERQKVRDKALEIIENLPVSGVNDDKYDPSKSMKTIEMWNNMYGKDEETGQVYSRQTLATEQNIMDSLNALEEQDNK